jgi:muconolactone delta-isomerase
VPPEQTLQTIEQAVVPSFQLLGQLQAQGKVKGGVFPGERAGAFVVEADSFEDLDSLMNHLPFFGLIKWQVKALMPFGTIAQQIPQYLQDIRQQMQSGPQSAQ